MSEQKEGLCENDLAALKELKFSVNPSDMALQHVKTLIATVDSNKFIPEEERDQLHHQLMGLLFFVKLIKSAN